MPPANSPDREPTPSNFISALRDLESAIDEDVLNLAATLSTQVADHLDEARASLRELEAAREHNQRQRRDDEGRHDRLRRSMDRLHRLHDPAPATRTTPYGERVPSQNSLYDWSPLPDPDALDDADADERSLRALQAVRRHPRFSARTTEYLQRYHRDRDREREMMRDAAREAARETASLRRSSQHPWAGPRERYQASRTPQPPQTHTQTQTQTQTQAQTPPQPQPPPVAPMLPHTVKYLSRIRHAHTVDESLNCALEAGFLSKDYFCIQYADFLTDTASIPPPQETSWLAPGAVLSGCQHATPSTPTTTRPWLNTTHSTPRSLTSYLSPSPPTHTEPPPRQDRWPVKVTIHAVDWQNMSLSATMEAYNVPSHPHPLLSQLAAPPPQYTRTSSITTYLEGEILDFNTHTLLTESFKSSPATDALYWRKLPPFRDMPDDDVVRCLTSRRWWADFSTEWVCMRWKERCFVKSLRGGPDEAKTFDPQDAYSPPSPAHLDAADEPLALDDSGCGLTISGFYYVCLRRADGRVDGLYYDPMSSPYQCLVLESEMRGRFGTWGFC